MYVDDDTTLGDTRDWLNERLAEGHRCPCCGQFAKIYKRQVNSGMARALIALHKAGGARFYRHLARLARWTHEGAQLQWWGLIEPKANDPSRFRLTSLGMEFLRNEVQIPRYAHIYDGRLLKLDTGQWVDIKQALTTRFNYHELMST